LKDQLKLLRNAQSIDLYLDERHRAKEEIFHQLQEHKATLNMLAVDLDSQKASLGETIELRARREEELQEAAERHTLSKERLMSVASTKEYNAVEKEMESLKKKTDETREQLDHLKEAIEINERAIAEKQDKIADLTRQIDEVEKDAEGKIAILDKQIDEAKVKLKESRTNLKSNVVRRYDFIRSRRPGEAIVGARDGYCTGCFMSLPPQLFNQVHRGSTLEICPSCQRILFYQDDDTDAADQSGQAQA